MKRKKEDPLEKLHTTHASFKGFENEKSYKGNGQWRVREDRKGREEEEVIPIIYTMNINVTSHSEVVVVVDDEVEDVEPIKITNEMRYAESKI